MKASRRYGSGGAKGGAKGGGKGGGSMGPGRGRLERVAAASRGRKAPYRNWSLVVGP